MVHRVNVTEETLKTTLNLDVDQQLELALQSVAPTIKSLHTKAKDQRVLEDSDMDLLSKAVTVLVKIRQEMRRASEENFDPNTASEEELKKRAK